MIYLVVPIFLVLTLIVFEMVAFFSTRDADQERKIVKPKSALGWLGTITAGLLTLAIAGLLVWFGTLVLDLSYRVSGTGGLVASGLIVGGGFAFIGAGLHFFAYCTGGAIKAWLGSAWPKLVDYPYYTAGAIVLVSIATQTSTGFQLSALKLEIVTGMILLNLKILKTSTEIFTEQFASPTALLRTWPLKTILYEKSKETT